MEQRDAEQQLYGEVGDGQPAAAAALDDRKAQRAQQHHQRAQQQHIPGVAKLVDGVAVDQQEGVGADKHGHKQPADVPLQRRISGPELVWLSIRDLA